jgi:hypothetical protein
LIKPFTKNKELVEGLKVKAPSSSSSTAKKKLISERDEDVVDKR